MQGSRGNNEDVERVDVAVGQTERMNEAEGREHLVAPDKPFLLRHNRPGRPKCGNSASRGNPLEHGTEGQPVFGSSTEGYPFK